MKYKIENIKNKIICGDALKELKKFPDDCVDTIITSPAYWGLRDYGVEGQYGLEKTLEEYIEKHLKVTAELKRVLKPTGVMYWNHGDCYRGSGCGKGDYREKISLSKPKHYTNKPNPQLGLTPKCLVLQNYRLILKMINQGWILRNTIIWSKPNAMPSSVKDRFSNKYEPVFILVKRKKYWFDLDVVREPYTEPLNRWGGPETKKTDKSKGDKWAIQERAGRKRRPNVGGKNPGDVWEITTESFPFDWCPKCNKPVFRDEKGEGFTHTKCGTKLVGHFATFPQKLIIPMIKSSCPQWICKKCGKARVRITKPAEWYRKLLGKSLHNHKDDMGAGMSQKKTAPSVSAEYKTIGWTDCGCKAGWKSGIVLDPFIGSGTVGVVAKKLKRNYIGLELNPDYVKMAEKRIKETPQLLL